MSRGPVAVFLLLALASSTASAQTTTQREHPSEPRATRSEFWREVAEPRYRRSRTLLHHAMAQLRRYDEVPEQTGPAQRRALLEAAINRLELALRITPDDPEVLYALAVAKMSWKRPQPGGGELRRDDEALELFERLRAIDPDFNPTEVAFQLGVLHTRARRFEQAAMEYQRSIDQELIIDTSATALANLAEVTMLAGDVSHAARHYEHAVEVARRLGASTDLPLWGLAVALDRLGEHRAALDRAREALAAGQGTTERLHDDNVFFEPPYEIFWYEALAAEADAEMQSTAETRRARLAGAVEKWQSFLSHSDGDSRWEDIARRNLAAVTAQLERGR